LRLSLLIATLNVFVSKRPLRFDTVDRGTALRSSALRRKDPMKNLLTDISGVRVGHADDSALASGVTAVVFDQPAVDWPGRS
jgi:hypothetical protein